MARVAGNREPSAALAARLGMKDWQVDRARRDLIGLDRVDAGHGDPGAARADAEVKGGSRDAVFALERLSPSSPRARRYAPPDGTDPAHTRKARP